MIKILCFGINNIYNLYEHLKILEIKLKDYYNIINLEIKFYNVLYDVFKANIKLIIDILDQEKYDYIILLGINSINDMDYIVKGIRNESQRYNPSYITENDILNITNNVNIMYIIKFYEYLYNLINNKVYIKKFIHIRFYSTPPYASVDSFKSDLIIKEIKKELKIYKVLKII